MQPPMHLAQGISRDLGGTCGPVEYGLFDRRTLRRPRLSGDHQRGKSDANRIFHDGRLQGISPTGDGSKKEGSSRSSGQPAFAGESDAGGRLRVDLRGSAPETPAFFALRQQHGNRRIGVARQGQPARARVESVVRQQSIPLVSSFILVLLAQGVKCRGLGGGAPKPGQPGDTRMDGVFLAKPMPPSPQFREEPQKSRRDSRHRLSYVSRFTRDASAHFTGVKTIERRLIACQPSRRGLMLNSVGPCLISIVPSLTVLNVW